MKLQDPIHGQPDVGLYKYVEACKIVCIKLFHIPSIINHKILNNIEWGLIKCHHISQSWWIANQPKLNSIVLFGDLCNPMHIDKCKLVKARPSSMLHMTLKSSYEELCRCRCCDPCNAQITVYSTTTWVYNLQIS